MNRPALTTLTLLAAVVVAGCATQERLELPVKLPPAGQPSFTIAQWHDERPPSDGAKSETPTAIGFLVTLGDDVSSPSAIEYLRNRIQADSHRHLSSSTVRVKRLRLTAESRNSWASLGYRTPTTVPVATWEMKQMPIEHRSKVEAVVLLEVDGKDIEAKSAIPFDRQPSSADIVNAIKAVADNVSRALAQ
jgi:hypothetical protein